MRLLQLVNGFIKAIVDGAGSGIDADTVDGLHAAEIATGLETIDEGNGDGLAIIGRVAANYGDLGLHAVDLSYSTSTSTVLGATGAYSHAEGYNTEAGGAYSHTEGANTLASGASSHAEGSGTIALNNYSHAAGKFNIGTASDTIHETGIGTGTSARKNAFEIYTDGTLTAPELTITLIDARGNKALITKEYVSDVYRRSNALGTVSQTSGVPTGALMEYGSNANGEYWKYAGGMQITKSVDSITVTTSNTFGTLSYANAVAITYPAAFIAIPSSCAHVSQVLGITFHATFNATGTTGTSVVVGGGNTSATAKVRIVSVGRWF